MTVALSGAPFPVTYRELWLPPGIAGTIQPTSAEGGHELVLTNGARKATTCDGVHFTGANDSNINCGAIHHAAAKLWISFRFKLDQPFTPGLGDQWIMGKYIHGNDFFTVRLADNGYLYWRSRTTGTDRFTIGVYRAVWTTGWYHVIFSLSSAEGARMVIDGAEYTDPNTSPAVNGGDLVFGDRDDPGGGTGFKGVITDIFVGIDDLSAGEESDLNKNVVPIDAREVYTLDEGRGTTAYNRGLAGAGSNGTLDTTATWKFGQVQQPVISFDNINDHAVSAAGVVDIAGDITLVWVGKMKSIYTVTTRISDKYMVLIHTGNDNRIAWMFTNGVPTLRLFCDGGTVVNADSPIIPAIDDYWVVIGTYTITGKIALFINGSLVDSGTGGDTLPGGLTRASLGAYTTPDRHDYSKPLFAALIDGAFTEKQARAYSRYLRNVFNLPITI